MSDWTAATDPGSGRTYYYNTVTQETSWEAPAGFETAAAEPATSASQWTSAVDPGSGQTYYYNAVTGETRWEAPEGYGEADDGAAAAAAAAESADAGGSESKASDSAKAKRAKRTSRRASIAKTGKKKVELSLAQKLKLRSSQYALMRRKEKQMKGGGCTLHLPARVVLCQHTQPRLRCQILPRPV